MRLRIASLILTVFALTAGAQFPATQTGVEIQQALSDRVAGGGSALVIVGIQMTFVPEGDLSADAVALQRDAISRAVEDVSSRAAAAGIDIGHRFSIVPYFTARVTGAAELTELATMPGVASIEEDQPERISLAQSVPLIGANTSHAAGFNGAGWAVSILDTGVQKTHPAFGARVVQEGCYSNAGGLGDGVSLCPGGVTATTAPGSGVNCNAALDGCEHGTHVAGIAAGSTGVAPGANILAFQVFTRFDDFLSCGGDPPCIATFAGDQIAALERTFVLAGQSNVNRVASINMSLGGATKYTAHCDSASGNGGATGRKAAIDTLRSIGIATAIASGNDGTNGVPGISSPSCISSAISVGSTTKADGVSSFSNYAPILSLMAPGQSINAPVPTNLSATLSGTSMATPHVAGAWAVLKHAVPGASVSDVLAALQNTGVPINDGRLSVEGDTTQAVFRRISVNAARLALGTGPPPAPGAPGAPSISGSGNNVTISWTPPTTGGAPTAYTVLARLTCAGGIVGQLNAGAATSVTVPGAPNGTFCVAVRASNAQGNGPESPGTSFNVPIAAPPPGAPTSLSVSVAGNTATFTWGPPASGGPVGGYILNAALSPGGAIIASLPLGPSVFALPVPNVPPGTYFVHVVAANSGGVSPRSNEVTVNVAGPQPPGAPSLNPASVSPGRVVTLSWAPGGGGAPTSYTVIARLSPAGAVIASANVGAATGVSLSAPPGTYFVQVVASNGLGSGPPSNQITVVVP